DNLIRPVLEGWVVHREVCLATGRWESTGDVVGLALRRDKLEDEHVLSHPAFFFRHDRCDTQCVALLRQDSVAAVARTVGPNFLGVWEMRDVLGVIAWPWNIFLTWLQRSTNRVQSVYEIAVLTNLVQCFLAHAGHDAHGQNNVCRVSQLNTE